MLSFTDYDEFEINNAYKEILLNLKKYLQKYNIENELDYFKILIKMLHNGLFSKNSEIQLDNYYNYIGIPLQISLGVHVMYGICCCRHTTSFFYDLSKTLKLDTSLIYFLINDYGIWRKVNPAVETANHVAISYGKEKRIIIDSANKFILQIKNNGQVESLNIELNSELNYYQEPNINIVQKVLKKYYIYRDLGIEHIY